MNEWLSKAKRRAREGLMQAVGAHTATEDQEFDNSYRNFANHVNELQKLKQLMEMWVESFEAFSAASYLLANAWKSYHQHGQSSNEDQPKGFQVASSELDKIFLNIQEDISPIIKSAFTSRCIKPVVNYLSLVPTVQELIQDRRTLLLDFDSYKSRIQKEHAAGRDSTHPNVVKKAAKLDESAKKLHAVQSSITRTFNEFEKARPESLGLELGAFLACVHSFAYNLSNSTAKLLPVVPQSASTLAIINYNITSIVPNVVKDDWVGVGVETSGQPGSVALGNPSKEIFDPESTSSSTKSLPTPFSSSMDPSRQNTSTEEEVMEGDVVSTLPTPPPKPPKHARSRPNSTQLDFSLPPERLSTRLEEAVTMLSSVSLANASPQSVDPMSSSVDANPLAIQ